MQRIALPPMERRLQKRYLRLVDSHMRGAHELAAGVASLPSAGSAFAATQAAWRFFNNNRVQLPTLVEPLREVGRDRGNASTAKFLMVAHDWCKVGYDHPVRKRDMTQLTHETDVGYELTTALLIDAMDGAPLAPMEMHLKTDQGVLSTRPGVRNVGHLEQVLPTMRASLRWGLQKPILHVIDREADSVDHYRRWDAAGQLFLVRGDNRRVKWEGKTHLLTHIVAKLRRRGKMKRVGEAAHQGGPALLYVSETEVTLHRPAKKSVRGRKYEKPGRPLRLRFMVVQLRDENGQRVLAEWLLLSNMPISLASAEMLARCYYWRWRIESFFKLLKSHGQQLEAWLQETGIAIARRLLVAAMACVTVWKLQADQSPLAMELKTLLVRMSGRQMKRTKPHTAPALLAGLWILLSMLALLEHYSLQDIRRLANKIPFRNTG